jgi:hypothetical protein
LLPQPDRAKLVAYLLFINKLEVQPSTYRQRTAVGTRLRILLSRGIRPANTGSLVGPGTK